MDESIFATAHHFLAQQENSRLKRRIAALEKQLRELQAAPRPSPFAKFEVRPPCDPEPKGPPPEHEAHHREFPEPDETLEVTLPKCPGCQTSLGEPLEYVDHTVEDVEPDRRVEETCRKRGLEFLQVARRAAGAS